MALLHNTVIQSAMLGRRMAGLEPQLPLTGFIRAERNNWYEGGHLPDPKSGYADGCLPPATWMMPRVAGGMSSRYFAGLAIAASGAGAMGVPIAGSAALSINFANAAGQLISSGTGSASFSFTTAAEIQAVLNGIGSASFTLSTNTPQLLALGWAEGNAAMAYAATLTAYARGNMVGSTVVESTLTSAAIAAAVLDLLNATTIPVDMQKVRGQSLTGTGSEADPWGP